MSPSTVNMRPTCHPRSPRLRETHVVATLADKTQAFEPTSPSQPLPALLPPPSSSSFSCSSYLFLLPPSPPTPPPSILHPPTPPPFARPSADIHPTGVLILLLLLLPLPPPSSFYSFSCPCLDTASRRLACSMPQKQCNRPYQGPSHTLYIQGYTGVLHEVTNV